MEADHFECAICGVVLRLSEIADAEILIQKGRGRGRAKLIRLNGQVHDLRPHTRSRQFASCKLCHPVAPEPEAPLQEPTMQEVFNQVFKSEDSEYADGDSLEKF